MKKYNHKQIESKWQKYWAQKNIFKAQDFSKKKKKFVLTEFPYPSGEGLHMGHLRPYVAGDVYSRFQRLNGKEVLFPMGWDAFGLPAENYAIKKGVHPSITTKRNIANAKKQLQSWGLSFDWSREINTTDPQYYKWTQWLFLQFYKAGLAYEATGLINWCPKDKTGLANEEVIDGKCERCGSVVEKKELRQWYLKITKYAEKLLDGLKDLPDWPKQVKLQQENWIGRSVGAEIEFPISANSTKRTEDSDSKPNFVLLHGFTANPQADFYPWLKKELELRGFTVAAPALPNTEHPTEDEQVNFVLENCKFDDNTVVVGHSLGSVVAMKVLENLGHSIKGLLLVGGFIDSKFKDHDRNFKDQFTWKFDFKKIRDNAKVIVLLHDQNDPAVSLAQAQRLSRSLNVPLKIDTAKESHFTASREPEILRSVLDIGEADKSASYNPNAITVFTTRPDTIFGATYLVVAPEHPLIGDWKLEIGNWDEVEKYIDSVKNKSEIERTAEGKEKTGVELKGIKAINPATKEKIPVWVADYVLGHYGTGAIMAVPAHDERDFEFAKKFGLVINRVIQPNVVPSPVIFTGPNGRPDMTQEVSKKQAQLESNEEIYTGTDGTLINSGEFTGLSSEVAIPEIANKFGKLKTQYKLRDWVFSRQRYWGEPIPIIHCSNCGIVPVPEKDLPVKLPNVKKYEPTGTGESPLAKIKNWVNVKCPKCKGPAKRETNTMPQWAGSSWYWLRYNDPKNKKAFADRRKQNYWTPIDIYFGGMEHTTLHLLYSRFWNLFLYDQKLVTQKEPYKKRQPHGIVLAGDGEKMSKSRGNVVNPDDIVKQYGADTLRMYELFLGPHELMVSWNDQGIVGVRRFLDRVWAWIGQRSEVKGRRTKVKDNEKVQRELNKLIKKITEDAENIRFNTCISAFMEFHNQVKDEQVSLESIKTFLVLLYPFAPHIVEELNQITVKSSNQSTNKTTTQPSMQFEKWPKWDELKLAESTAEMVVQVNGKVKGKITVPFDSLEDEIKIEALKLEPVKTVVGSQIIKKVIIVPKRLINLVI